MEGQICNIQVLLRAAEFLERRERGWSFFVERQHSLLVTKTRGIRKPLLTYPRLIAILEHN